MAILFVSGCATRSFEAGDPAQGEFVKRGVTQLIDGLQVTAAVPTAEEVLLLTGLDLYESGVQPIWLRVENRRDSGIRLALRSIEDEYFSPMEVAWAHRKPYNKQGRHDMERWFYEHQISRLVPAGEVRSGLVFTHMSRGTKGFNLDAYSNERSFNFTFFVRLPGFQADYMDVRFRDLYQPDEVVTTDIDGLHAVISNVECCSRDASGAKTGDPFNVVIVADPVALRRALLRSEWQETSSGSAETALARLHHYQGRIPDGTFHKARPDGTERKELRIWLTPILVGDTPVWLAQASYDMSGAVGDRAFEDYQIDPDLDDARMYVLQSFWYSQALEAFGIASGSPRTTIDAPGQNFLGDPYFTDGNRVILFIPPAPVGMDETRFIPWQRIDDVVGGS